MQLILTSYPTDASGLQDNPLNTVAIDLRELSEAIKKVEMEIQDLGSSLKKLEEEIRDAKKANDREELTYLRDEKNKLLDKEKQLRDEKKQLRDKEKKLIDQQQIAMNQAPGRYVGRPLVVSWIWDHVVYKALYSGPKVSMKIP